MKSTLRGCLISVFAILIVCRLDQKSWLHQWNILHFTLQVRLSKVLDIANVPKEGRIAAIPCRYLEDAKNDSRFIGRGGATEAAGFEILEVRESVMENRIVAGHSMAATMAENIVKAEAYQVHGGFSGAIKGLYLAGAQVIRPNASAVAILS